MNTQLIPVFAGQLAGEQAQLVDARLLHGFLQVGKDFSNWIKDRINEYGFTLNLDYLIDSPNLANQKGRGGDRRSKEYHLSIDMAKELGMIERNEKGRQIRQYFLAMEKAAKSSVGLILNLDHPLTLAQLQSCETMLRDASRKLGKAQVILTVDELKQYEKTAKKQQYDLICERVKQGVTRAAISDELGITRNNVRQVVFHARKNGDLTAEEGLV